MSDWQIAERKLARDKLFRPLVKRIGPCTLVPLQRDPYEALVRAIAHQQVPGRAADAHEAPPSHGPASS
jgi:DNA-3-methyladenine glycosylase II